MAGEVSSHWSTAQVTELAQPVGENKHNKHVFIPGVVRIPIKAAVNNKAEKPYGELRRLLFCPKLREFRRSRSAVLLSSVLKLPSSFFTAGEQFLHSQIPLEPETALKSRNHSHKSPHLLQSIKEHQQICN